MDLFASASDKHEPLAFRMRPRTLDEFAGQEHIVGKGRLLRRVIQADQLSSLIFYGPPGTGKTTLAWVIANSTKSTFITMNAVLSGVKDLREAIEKAKEQRDLYGKRTTLFVDEVHRWNKAQQDALLPWVENGTVIFVGATTQNPYFEVNPALVSRSRIFQLVPLTEDDLSGVVRRALADTERGYGRYAVELADDALRHLVKISNGDARSLLNALELAVETTPSTFPPPAGEPITVTLDIAEQSIQRKVVLYDKEGDYHFDTISAFIKSVRGSDPDATLYWLARMVHAGEDPHFIFRRMLVSASEDVGMADPDALQVVAAAAAAFDRVGLPEGRYHLAHAALYLSTCPKSNTIMGFFDALEHIESEAKAGEVPNHLRDASRDKEGFGHGEGYLYPHAFRDHWVSQQYLPAALQGKIFYEPSEVGYEARIRDTVQRRREIQLAQASEPPSVEVLTFSPPDRERDRWLARVGIEQSAMLSAIRDKVIEGAALRRHDRVLDADARSGLLLWEAVRRTPEGGTWAIVTSDSERELIEHELLRLSETERPRILQAERALLDPPLFPAGRSAPLEERVAGASARNPLAAALADGMRFDAIVGRNLLTRVPDKEAAFFVLRQMVERGGRLSIAETVPSRAPLLSDYLSDAVSGLSADEQAVVGEFAKAEQHVRSQLLGEITGWPPEELERACRAAGFAECSLRIEQFAERRTVAEKQVDAWFGGDSAYGRAVSGIMTPGDIGRIVAVCKRKLAGTELSWPVHVAFLRAAAAD